MNAFTRITLVLLRLVIGWHLLFAGLVKFRSDYKGSEGYLEGAVGPAAPMFHWLTRERLADRLGVAPLAAGEDPKNVPPNKRLPPLLDAEWEEYFDKFVAYYGLDDAQKAVARKNLDQAKHSTGDWLLRGQYVQTITSPYGPTAEIERSVQDTVKYYQERRQKLWETQAKDQSWTLGNVMAADKSKEFAAERAELARLRNGLTADLDKHTKEMKARLLDAVPANSLKEKGLMPDPAKPGFAAMGRLDWVDFGVRWGLTVVGGCLLLGFFTRTACVLGALLLLLFYLPTLPLPGVPEAFRAEGYPYVNKNLVECLALLTLATTASGRWGGIDGIVHALFGRRRKAEVTPATVAVQQQQQQQTATPIRTGSPVKI